MDVEEQNIEDLFEDEAPSDNDDENEGNINGSQMRETSLANLELGDRSGNLNSTTNDEQSSKKEVKPKRKIAKQPLLNADRVLGKRGIRELEKIFRDFEPREGKEYEDLDIVVSKMKHWAHRLYPKLPFDDVTKQISNLGKKMQIQTNLKKIRMGEDVDPYFDKDVVDKDEDRNMGSDIEQDEKDKDEVERYDDEPQEDVFEQLIRESNERIAREKQLNGEDSENDPMPNAQPLITNSPPKECIKPSLTDEQRERMLRNRQLAEERRKKKIEEQTQTLKDSQSITNDYNDSTVMSE